MLWITLLWLSTLLSAGAQSTQGIVDLVRRRMPGHANSFEFELVGASSTANQSNPLDEYNVTSTSSGKILVQGTSLSALASGLVLLW
jgi:alpha-N-acetylglucosaminidase